MSAIFMLKLRETEEADLAFFLSHPKLRSGLKNRDQANFSEVTNENI